MMMMAGRQEVSSLRRGWERRRSVWMRRACVREEGEEEEEGAVEVEEAGKRMEGEEERGGGSKGMQASPPMVTGRGLLASCR